MKKLSILAVLIGLSGFFVLGGEALAAPAQLTFGSSEASSFAKAGDVPSGATLVLDITYQVTNDEDSGIFGYWALDNYLKSVRAWVADKIYFEVRYAGKWRTFEGALSPELGMIQSDDASGTFKGGYTATCTGTFTPGSQKTKGYIGSFNYGGTKADVLKGTYGNGQTGPTTPFDFVSAYFDSACSGSFTKPSWGWTYQHEDQVWNNFYTANIGDIWIWDLFGHPRYEH